MKLSDFKFEWILIIGFFLINFKILIGRFDRWIFYNKYYIILNNIFF